MVQHATSLGLGKQAFGLTHTHSHTRSVATVGDGRDWKKGIAGGRGRLVTLSIKQVWKRTNFRKNEKNTT